MLSDSVTRLLWICLGGAAGSGARYLVALWTLRAWPVTFPLATLIVNVVGSFLLAALMVVVAETEWVAPDLGAALSVGLLGGFTTYSTFNYDTLVLLAEGAWGIAAWNVALTVAGCLGAALAGVSLARWLVVAS